DYIRERSRSETEVPSLTLAIVQRSPKYLSVCFLRKRAAAPDEKEPPVATLGLSSARRPCRLLPACYGASDLVFSVGSIVGLAVVVSTHPFCTRGVPTAVHRAHGVWADHRGAPPFMYAIAWPIRDAANF